MASDRQKIIIVSLLSTAFLSYSIFIYWSLPVKQYPISNVISRGKFVWQKYNCNACHQIYGLGGYLGPDLTNVYSIRGAGYIKAFLLNGTATMPNFHMKEQEISDLLSFLKNIDASGKSDPRTFTIQNNGTIEQ